MADVTGSTNSGAAAAMEQVGRDITWLQNTTDLSGAPAFEAAVKALQAGGCTLTIVGTPSAAGCTVGVEGFGAAVAGWAEVTLGGLTFA